MAYYTGTINSATPAVAYMDAIHPQMQSGGLTFVETYTSGTDVTNIYKSPAGSNSLGIDYFIFINRPSTTGAVSWSISELYDVSTHLASKYAPYGTPTTANADYSVAGTCLPSATTAGASLSKTGPDSGVFIPINTAYTYYLNVTPERVIFGFNNPVAVISTTMIGMGYIGIFEPLYDSIASIPTLGVVLLIPESNIHNAGNHQQATWFSRRAGATTRDYGVATTVSSTAISAAHVWLLSTFGTYSGLNFTAYGSLKFPDVGDSNAYSNSAKETRKVPVCHARAIPSFTVAGQSRSTGVLKDVIFNSTGSGLSGIGGDTLSVTNFAGTVLNYVKCGSPGTQNGMYWFPVQ